MRIRAAITAWVTFLISSAAVDVSHAQQWVRCADEGGVCDLDGVGMVRYGTGNRWVYVIGTDRYACNRGNAGFDPDPAPGESKACWRWQVVDETARSKTTADLNQQVKQLQEQIAALQVQQQYVADLEEEVAVLRRELRQVRRDRRDDRREFRLEFGPPLPPPR